MPTRVRRGLALGIHIFAISSVFTAIVAVAEFSSWVTPTHLATSSIAAVSTRATSPTYEMPGVGAGRAAQEIGAASQSDLRKPTPIPPEAWVAPRQLWR